MKKRKVKDFIALYALEDEEKLVLIQDGISADKTFLDTFWTAHTHALAMADVKTGQVTYAVRDTHIDDKEIHEGDIMGIADQGIVAVGESVEKVSLEMLQTLVDEDTSLISLYYGEDVQEEDASKLAEEVEALYPEIDIDLHLGGQPIYYYVMAVE